MDQVFRKFAVANAELVETSCGFLLSLLILIIWAFSGSMFGFPDTRQLMITMSTSGIIFLMVFLAQITQNRKVKIVQSRLDELLCSVKERTPE